MSVHDLLTGINREDRRVADAVAASKYGDVDRICAAIDRLGDRPTNLYLDGNKFAEAAAEPNDRVQGGRQELSDRGVAL